MTNGQTRAADTQEVEVLASKIRTKAEQLSRREDLGNTFYVDIPGDYPQLNPIKVETQLRVDEMRRPSLLVCFEGLTEGLDKARFIHRTNRSSSAS